MPPITVSAAAISLEDAAIRVGLAMLLGAVLGFEREARDRAAGLRTHMLVAAASATFGILALELFAMAEAREFGNADPLRIIEAVTAGVAFLAAGAIIRQGRTVKGLTTGAGMWMAGAIGVACGTGYFALAFVAGAVAFFILAVVRLFEQWWF